MLRIVLWLLASLLLSGCQSNSSSLTEWQPKLLLSATQCQLDKPEVRWIVGDTDVQTRLLELIGPEVRPLFSRFGSGELAPRGSGLLLVAAGAQPNPGYGLEYLGAGRSDGQGALKLIWKTPDPDWLYPMVRVYPCLLFELPLSAISELRVLDQQDSERYRIAVPAPD